MRMLCNIISGGSRISRRGGACTRCGGVDLQRGHFLVKMYAKTKELGPMGSVRRVHPPRSANDNDFILRKCFEKLSTYRFNESSTAPLSSSTSPQSTSLVPCTSLSVSSKSLAPLQDNLKPLVSI